MELGKQFTRLNGEIRELLAKLTVSQKITIGLLTAILAGGVVLAVVLARGEPYVPLGTASDAKSVAAMKSLLEQNSIPYREGTKGEGGALQVPRDRAGQARWLAAEGGARDSNMEWLFGEASFLDTENRIDQRLRESRKRTVEDSIRWSRSVRDVKIVVQQGPEPIFVGRAASSDSAAVAVALRAGVEALSRAEAATIRALVAGAFNLLPQNIQVTDDHLHSYPHLDAPAGGLSEDEDRTRKAVQTTVEALLGRVYRPQEFVVGVLADVSLRKAQLKTLTYDPEKVAQAERSSLSENETTTRPAALPVGVEPNVQGGLGAAAASPAADSTSRERKERTFDSRFSESEERVEVPAGELKGLSVNVVLDRSAMRRVLQAEEFTRLTPDRKEKEKVQAESDIVNFTVEGKTGANNLDQAIEAHRRAQAEFLKEQLPMSGAKVNVSVIMFPKPEMPTQLAAATSAMGWASDHWSDLLLGSVAVVGLFLVYRMFQKASVPPLDVPSLDESALLEETRKGDEEIRTLEEVLSGAAPGGATSTRSAGGKAGAGEKGEPAREMAESVKAVNDLSKKSPEMASAVVRLWMAQDRE